MTWSNIRSEFVTRESWVPHIYLCALLNGSCQLSNAKLLSIPYAAVAQWLRCCATNQKVTGSIPARVIWIFHWHKILPIDSASNRNGGRCVRLTTYHHPVPLSWKLGTLTSWNPLGLSRPVMGLLYLYLTVILTFVTIHNVSDTLGHLSNTVGIT